MPTYTQDERELSITTPSGKDHLLLVGLRGSEAISQLFAFQLDLLAELSTKIEFEKIIGKKATIEMRLPTGEKRYFDGIIKALTQRQRDEVFLHFRAELVPKLWLLTKKIRCRIFQQLPVPEILKQVLTGLDVTYKLSATYYNREYCVQYRESDFNFASRLMEEEGIYYFFDHTHDKHQLVVTDDPTQHPAVEGQVTVTYEELGGGVREDLRIHFWEKTQDLRSGEYTLWDHNFELPGKNLEAKEKTIGSIKVGTVDHELSVGGNDQLEIYDYPGGYAQRFDGVGRSGGDQPQSLQDVFRDKDRTVRIRMEQEEVAGIQITGSSNCGHFSPGHRFTFERHFDAAGAYLLTRLHHEARIAGNYRSSEDASFSYENSFDCIPLALPYRPQRVTHKPEIAGIQTATVVCPKGEEIFIDKYGRVKVQFHWDREGKLDGDSSCWVRVSQVWAGKGWGAFFWPRGGHEVVIAFEEGDPDQPIVVGSVYNAENMPWFALPKRKMLAGFKSESFSGTAGKNYNGIVFNDQKGREHLALHSERNLSLNSENDKMIHSGSNKGERVAVSNVFSVGKLLPTGGSGGGDGNQPSGSDGGGNQPSGSTGDTSGTGGNGSSSSGGGGYWDEGNPVPYPPPTGLFGLNAQSVVGMNQSTVLGFNGQVAFGENLQIVINPLGFLDTGLEGKAGDPTTNEPKPFASLLGGGLGGNMQFTMGSNGQLTYGRNFDYTVGPVKAEKTVNNTMCIRVMCWILFAVEAAYLIAYDLVPVLDSSPSGDPSDQPTEQSGDNWRAGLTVASQLVAAALVATIMECAAREADIGQKTIDKTANAVGAPTPAPAQAAAPAQPQAAAQGQAPPLPPRPPQGQVRAIVNAWPPKAP